MPKIEIVHVTWILVIYIFVTRILHIYKDNDKRCLIRQRTYNITYNIHSILRHLFISIGRGCSIGKDIQGHTQDIHRTYIVRGGLLYAD